MPVGKCGVVGCAGNHRRNRLPLQEGKEIFVRVKDLFRRSEEKALATCPSYRLVMVAVELTNEDEGDEREDDEEEKESCCCCCCCEL